MRRTVVMALIAGAGLLLFVVAAMLWSGRNQELTPAILRRRLRQGQEYSAVLAAFHLKPNQAPLQAFAPNEYGIRYFCRLTEAGRGANFVWQHEVMAYFDGNRRLIRVGVEWVRFADERYESVL